MTRARNLTLTLIIALAAIAGAASAVQARSTLSEAFTFGPGGAASGKFGEVQSIAVDQASGYVYVYDTSGSGTLYKFDSSGKPANFTATATNAVTGVGKPLYGASESQIAVDNSSAATKGDIYVAPGSGAPIGIYSAAGQHIGELGEAPGVPWGEAGGVAVDSAGNLYVGIYSEVINKYVPSSNPATNADYKESIVGAANPQNLAVDAAGDVFAVTYPSGPVTRYAPSQFGQSSATGTVVDTKGSTLAIDASSGVLYVDEQTQFSLYQSSGAFIRSFALPEGANSYGIGVDSATHDIYVANNGTGQVEAYEEVAITPPVVDEVPASASSIESTSALLSGKVNIKGTPDATYQFVYGETETYGKATPLHQLTATSLVGPEQISGLRPETTYHFTLVATNEEGTTQGPDYTLTTGPAVLPGAETGGASGIGQASVTLSATVQAQELPTAYGFEVGTSSGSYGPAVLAGSASSGEAQQVSLALTGLQPGTTYYYRVFATNQEGTSYGAERQFTTAPLPSPLTLLPAPTMLATPPISFPTGTGILPSEGIRVLHRSFDGRVVKLRIRVPASGRLTAKGAGLTKASKRIHGAKTFTVVLRLSKSGKQLLSLRSTRKLSTDVKLVLATSGGKRLTASATVRLR